MERAKKGQKKFQRIVGTDIEKTIEGMVMEDYRPPAIHAQLVKQYKGRAPSLRTVETWYRKLSPPDLTGAWSFAEGEDVDLVLPVLGVVISVTRGRRKELSNAEAHWIAKIRRVAPDRPFWEAYVLARLYILRGQANLPSPDIDAYLAFAPWRGEPEQEAYERALEEGWVTMVPHMSPGLFADYEPGTLRKGGG